MYLEREERNEKLKSTITDSNRPKKNDLSLVAKCSTHHSPSLNAQAWCRTGRRSVASAEPKRCRLLRNEPRGLRTLISPRKMSWMVRLCGRECSDDEPPTSSPLVLERFRKRRAKPTLVAICATEGSAGVLAILPLDEATLVGSSWVTWLAAAAGCCTGWPPPTALVTELFGSPALMVASGSGSAGWPGDETDSRRCCSDCDELSTGPGELCEDWCAECCRRMIPELNSSKLRRFLVFLWLFACCGPLWPAGWLAADGSGVEWIVVEEL